MRQMEEKYSQKKKKLYHIRGFGLEKAFYIVTKKVIRWALGEKKGAKKDDSCNYGTMC